MKINLMAKRILVKEIYFFYININFLILKYNYQDDKKLIDGTSILKNWYKQNIDDPFPTKKTKKELALESNLSEIQVTNWFKKARLRGVYKAKKS